MNELERLLAITRRHDPVPPGTVARVERRLGDPRSGVTWGWGVAVSAALMAIWAWPKATPLVEGTVERGRPAFVAERLQPRPTPAASAEARVVEPTAPKAPEPPPTITQLGPAHPTPAPMAEPSLAPQVEVPAPAPPVIAPAQASNARRTLGYRPRAFRDPSAFEWQTLEGEALPAAIQAIVARRDPGALLAALDPLTLDRRALLLARGELRAADDRCEEALSDFDQVLRKAPAEPRALAGRAACRP